MDIKRIREAIEKHYGGIDSATDQQIMKMWDSLGSDTRHAYMESVRTLTRKRGEKDADTTETEL